MSGLGQPMEIGAKTFVEIVQFYRLEDVEFGAPTALEGKSGFVVQIELAGKKGVWPASAFCDGADAAEYRGKPLDDQTCICQRPGAENKTFSSFIHWKEPPG